MGKHAVFVCGPAGSGKSTFCSLISRHTSSSRRNIHIVNLDPAAESFEYPVSIDIRQLISLDEVMEELELGPNGGLIYCFEYLVEHLDWLEDQIDDFSDDYLIFDCPGQIELYSHIPVMKTLTRQVANWGYQMCSVYLLDSHFVTDEAKFVSGTLSCLSAMVQMELPHVNILSKCDLMKFSGTDVEKVLDTDIDVVVGRLPQSKYSALDRAIGEILSEYAMVSFVPLDPSDEESLKAVMYLIDSAVQYGEDVEPGLDEDREEKERELEDRDIGERFKNLGF